MATLTGIKEEACIVDVTRCLLNHLDPTSIRCLTDIFFDRGLQAVVVYDDVMDTGHACEPEEIHIGDGRVSRFQALDRLPDGLKNLDQIFQVCAELPRLRVVKEQAVDILTDLGKFLVAIHPRSLGLP